MGKDLALTRESLVGLLCAAAELDCLPAQLWPLDGTLEYLAKSAPPEGPIQRVLMHWPTADSGPGLRFVALPQLIRKLTALHLLTPEGTGWAACYRLKDGWRAASVSLLRRLPEAERTSLNHAAQRLQAMATMASKNPAAAESRAGTI